MEVPCTELQSLVTLLPSAALTALPTSGSSHSPSLPLQTGSSPSMASHGHGQYSFMPTWFCSCWEKLPGVLVNAVHILSVCQRKAFDYGWTWWHMPVIPVLGKMGQEKACLAYRDRPCPHMNK